MQFLTLIAEIVFVIALLAVVAYWASNTLIKARLSKVLMATIEVYHAPSEDHRSTLLVLGDSTAVGVGAEKKEDSVPGQLAHFMGATHVENYAVSGAGVEDIPLQIAKATLPRYDTILLMVGGNNILAFDNVRWAGRILGEVLSELPEAERVYVMNAGNAGGATLFPPPVRFFHTRTNLDYHKEFSRVCEALNATYINLYMKPHEDPFLKEPEVYLSKDGLHPSSLGYQLWFEKLKERI